MHNYDRPGLDCEAGLPRISFDWATLSLLRPFPDIMLSSALVFTILTEAIKQHKQRHNHKVKQLLKLLSSRAEHVSSLTSARYAKSKLIMIRLIKSLAVKQNQQITPFLFTNAKNFQDLCSAFIMLNSTLLI
jgi:hypothetical protein